MFKGTEPFRPPDALLEELALRMVDTSTGLAPELDNPDIPAGYTFLGQFLLDHDITLDTTPLGQQQSDPPPGRLAGPSAVPVRPPRRGGWGRASAWVLEATTVARGPDNEPLVRLLRPVAWIGEETMGEAEQRCEEHFDTGQDSTE